MGEIETDKQGNVSGPRGQLFAWLTVGLFMGIFLCLVLLIALAPAALSASAVGGMTWGHVLVLVMHAAPVTAAWLYIYFAPEAEQ